MNVNFFQEDNTSMSTYAIGRKPVKKYRFRNLLLDCLLTAITGGFWLIWIFVREMRKR